MKFIKKNLWAILSLTLVVVLGFAGDANATNTTQGIDQIAINKATQVFQAARNIMFVVGGLGLVAVAFGAIAGKINWKWVGALSIGLAIIAAASAVINYAISDEGTGTTGDEFRGYGDTLNSGSGTVSNP